MTIIDAETLECACEGGGIFDYVVPEPRVVLWAGTVPKFDAIAPDDDLPTKIGLGWWHGKVFKGIRIPDPAVVGQGILEWVCLGLRQAGKVRLHEG